MANLNLKNITKKFGRLTVLDDISLDIKDGEFVALVGPSGCGKSTLLNVIAGLENISSGTIDIDGQKVNDFEPKERDIAMVFQSYALYPNLNVKENISFGLKNRKVMESDIESRVSLVAKQLQIDHLLDRKPSQLSGGQRQRVAMGRAIARDPKIYLFDEPLSNLDAKLRVEMRMEIKLLHQRVKNTVVYVTHDQTEAMTLADRIALLNKGKLAQVADPISIYNNPINMFVAGFIGSPAMNMIPSKIYSKDDHIFCKLTNADNDVFEVPINGLKKEQVAEHLDKEVILGIRPELITQPQEKQKGFVSIQASHSIAEPTGSDLYLSFKLNGANVTGRYNPDFIVNPNTKIPLEINTNKILAFDQKTQNRVF